MEAFLSGLQKLKEVQTLGLNSGLVCYALFFCFCKLFKVKAQKFVFVLFPQATEGK